MARPLPREPEQARRVLIVGGTPTDLTQAIAEAGFDADQRTWADAEAEARALEQRFDPEALIAYADEHGYGFLALMTGDDNPWPDGVLGEALPATAGAIVISVGELTLDGAPRLRAGGPPEGPEYSDALRRAESLRLALYEHPDLLRLWSEPTPEQMQQQLGLTALADARTILSRTVETYEAAVGAWPLELTADELTPPFTEQSGVPLAEGLLLVERVAMRLVVDDAREIEVALAPPRSRLLPADTPVEVGPLAHAALSVDRRWLASYDDDDGLIHRYELRDGALHERGEGVELPGGDGEALELLEISNAGVLAFAHPDRLELPFTLDLGGSAIDDLSWHGDAVLALALARDRWTAADHLLLARTGETPSAGPALLSLPVETLAPGVRDPGIVDLLASEIGTFVVVEYTGDEGSSMSSLLLLEAPATCLREPEPDSDPDALGHGLLDAAVPTNDELVELSREGLKLRSLGVVPPARALTVAPDGGWAAWRAVGSRGAIYVAPIEAGLFGAPVRVATDSPLSDRLGETPQFTADSQALVLTASRAWEYGTIEHLRRISLPPA